MNLTLFRTTSNYLYTEGELHINGAKMTFTVEETTSMLPTGNYQVDLVKKNAHCRELVIIPHPSPHARPLDALTKLATQRTPHPSSTEGWKLGVCHSWIDSRKEKTIAIGQPLIPGVLYKGADDYERLIKRLEKCKDRNEDIALDIVDGNSPLNTIHSTLDTPPIKHWLEHEKHGCPPSRIHVEADTDGNVTIRFANGRTKFISIEHQLQVRLANVTRNHYEIPTHNHQRPHP